jgi:flagellar biosynthesis protein FlhB
MDYSSSREWGELFIFAMWDWGVTFRSLDMQYITAINVSLFLLPAFDQLLLTYPLHFVLVHFLSYCQNIISKMTFTFETLYCFLQRMADLPQLSHLLCEAHWVEVVDFIFYDTFFFVYFWSLRQQLRNRGLISLVLISGSVATYFLLF